MKRITLAALLAGGPLALASCARRATTRGDAAPSYEVYAIRYATLPRFRVAGLVADADTARRLDIAMSVWMLRGSGRTILVDAGFYRAPFVQRWRPTDYVTPADAVARLGVKPEDVTDVIITHVHWDHLDGADLFPRARIWIQREEYEHHVDSAGRVLDRTIDPADAAMLHALRSAGRVVLIDGDDREIISGVRVYTGGKHTFASQYVGVRVDRGGTAVIASDNAYLYENLDRRVPIAQTLDRESNLRAQDRMRAIASELRLVVPGHDPAAFERFTQVSPGVVRIR